MLKKQKKGFTIVELVVVIAVVAILAAVLIPTFAGLIKKAQISNDQTLVRNLNTSLAISSEGGAGKSTMYETLEDMREQGYNVDKLTPTHNKNDIVWDSVRNQFVLVMENNEYYTGTNFDDYSNVDKTTLWKVYKEMPTESEYSIYLAGTTLSGLKTANGVGLDVGENKNVSVSYKNTTEKPNDHVIIRTNNAGKSVSINASTDSVSHYGAAEKVTITAVANHSYHEFGEVTTVVVKTGRVVVEEKATVTMVIANTTNVADVKVEVPSEEVKVYAPEGVEISSPNNTVKSSGVLAEEEIKNATTGANNFAGGFGTAANPYLIATKEDAMNIELNGGYFKLVNNIIVNDEIYMSSKTYVIDLNGHSITLEYGKDVKPNNGSVLYIGGENGNLTINDSSEAQTGAVYGSTQTFPDKVTSAVRAGNYGKLTINGGHFYGRSEGTSCIYTSGRSATVKIYGGKFETLTPFNGTYFVLNHQDGKAGASYNNKTGGSKMIVYGGEFKNFEPGKTFVDPVNSGTGVISIAEGYEANSIVDGSDTWYVVSKTQTTESAS